jgi:hypothetical protein
LRSIAQALDKLGAEWALVGGLAISTRAEPRTTRDVDIAIAVSCDEEAQDLVRRLLARGYSLLTTPLEHLDVNRVSTVRLAAREQSVRGIVVDLLFVSSGIEPEIVAAATPLVILQGLQVPVASLAHLMALKVLASRPQDLADIATMLRFASTADIQQAREALELIERRGFDRGKDLQASFAAVLDDFASAQ